MIRICSFAGLTPAGTRAQGKVSAKRKTGPTGRVRQAFEAVSRLPRRKQQKIIEVVEALVAQSNNA